jgi:two-component system response regulator
MSDDNPDLRAAEILLVEDSTSDVLITRAAFQRARILVNLHHVENGAECMAFLRKQGRYANVPTPDLILLDLNMPVMDGREVLAELIRDDELNHLPVVVLTTSEDERDVLNMYKLRCSSYITKPVDLGQFINVVQNVTDHWFRVVVRPPTH